MERYFTEQDLRALFQKNLDEKLLIYEDDFIKAVVDLDGLELCKTLANEDDFDEDDFDENGEEFEPPAQLSLKEHYVKLEELALDLLFSLLSGGVLEMILGMGFTPFATLAGLVAFARRAGNYCSTLVGEKRNFCRYLTTHCYTYGDRLRYFFSNGGAGFILNEAVEGYCQCRSEQSPETDIQKLRQDTEGFAHQLMDDGILIPAPEAGRYLICF